MELGLNVLDVLDHVQTRTMPSVRDCALLAYAKLRSSEYKLAIEKDHRICCCSFKCSGPLFSRPWCQRSTVHRHWSDAAKADPNFELLEASDRSIDTDTYIDLYILELGGLLGDLVVDGCFTADAFRRNFSSEQRHFIDACNTEIIILQQQGEALHAGAAGVMQQQAGTDAEWLQQLAVRETGAGLDDGDDDVGGTAYHDPEKHYFAHLFGFECYCHGHES